MFAPSRSAASTWPPVGHRDVLPGACRSVPKGDPSHGKPCQSDHLAWPSVGPLQPASSPVSRPPDGAPLGFRNDTQEVAPAHHGDESRDVAKAAVVHTQQPGLDAEDGRTTRPCSMFGTLTSCT